MLPIFNIIRKYFQSDAGSVILIAALLFPLIIGFAGVGVDISNWLMERRHLQTSADAAALAGAWEIANGGTTSSAQAAALKEATNNGYDPALSGTLTTTVSSSGSVSTVQVDIKEKVQVWFSSIFIDRTVYVATMAQAQTSAGGAFCALSLDPNDNGAVSVSGSATVNMPGCGIAVNSNSSRALEMTGSATVDVGAVRTVGGYSEGSSVDFQYASLRTNALPLEDPYASLGIPSFTSCTNTQMNSGPARYTSNATLSPGTYCGGIRISGTSTVTLNPGVYVMDGGDFNASGRGSITGTGVTIILTNSGGSSYGKYGNIDVSGRKSIYLQAPTTGTYAGIAIYQDRNASTVGSGDDDDDEGDDDDEHGGRDSGNKITGSSGIEVQGAVYTPSRQLKFGGNGRVTSSSTALCTQLLAKTIEFKGNAALDSNCTGSGTQSIGSVSAKLVL